ACRIALAIQRAENPKGACEIYHYNSDGTLDWGYFQINTVHLTMAGLNCGICWTAGPTSTLRISSTRSEVSSRGARTTTAPIAGTCGVPETGECPSLGGEDANGLGALTQRYFLEGVSGQCAGLLVLWAVLDSYFSGTARPLGRSTSG